MEIFNAVLSLMDSTIMAMLDIPIIALFLIGSFTIAVVGLCLMLRDAAGGHRK